MQAYFVIAFLSSHCTLLGAKILCIAAVLERKMMNEYFRRIEIPTESRPNPESNHNPGGRVKVSSLLKPAKDHTVQDSGSYTIHDCWFSRSNVRVEYCARLITRLQIVGS